MKFSSHDFPELDEQHDRHERIVKYSRDVTIESKKIIFMLHRYSGMRTDEDKRLYFRFPIFHSVEERSNFFSSNHV